MELPFPGIGVVFDINGLGGGFYLPCAHRLFLRHLDPRHVHTSTILEGDTAATLRGAANEFCIGISGLWVNVDRVRETFEGLVAPGFAPVHRRFIEKAALDLQPLVPWARVDAIGRLITKQWTRTDHDLCKETDWWGYRPDTVPADLDPDLRAELDEMGRRCRL